MKFVCAIQENARDDLDARRVYELLDSGRGTGAIRADFASQSFEADEPVETDASPVEQLAFPAKTGQEGCIVKILHRDSSERYFPDCEIETGGVGFRFCGTSARHWIVTYRTNDHD